MLSFWSKSEYHHLNQVRVSRAALVHNHQALQDFHPEAQVCPVLKSNAYGHGLSTIAPVFDSFGCPFLVVDSLYEAYQLQKLKVKTKILVMGYTHPDNFKVKRLPFEFAVFDLEVAHTLNQYQPGCSIHLFVDTGMSREGIPLAELPDFIAKIKKLPHLKVNGLASHLADADNPDDESFTQLQLNTFKQAIDIVHQAGLEPRWHHLSASSGAFKLQDPSLNMIRSGLAHYGYSPLEEKDPAYKQLKLQQALTFTSTLAQIKTIARGDRVGYNGTFTAPKPMTIGLLPAGYYEGIDRRLSNKGFVQIKNTFCPILGYVSMNMTTIDISAVPNPKVGDQVVIYSSDLKGKNSLIQAARSADTTPYELLVHIAESVKRRLE